MSQIKAHICIVSDQPLPNILPVLHPEMKPEKVYLLCSEEQRKQSNDKAQKKIIESLGCKVDIVDVSSAFDIEVIGEQTENILKGYAEPHNNLLLNATGGTKPMSIAAFEQCVCHDIGVFYVQTPEIIWLSESSRFASWSHIPNSLPLQKFIEAHCLDLQHLQPNRIPSAQSEMSISWADRAEKYSKEYSSINRYASLAKDHDLVMSIPNKDHRGNFQSLLSELEHGGYIRAEETGKLTASNAYRFVSEECRRFVNGGWLEDYVFQQIRSLKDIYPQINDVARNIEVKSNRNITRLETRNELDVVAIVNNRMWVFECKTRIYEKSSTHGEEMIYKLAGIMKNMGGMRTRGCVVSFNALRNVEKSRADLLNIDVVDGRHLSKNNFRSKLVQIFGLKG
ncbi:MAG: DUF1887 family protein [Gammaproteobacteria bacterium]|nr:DUF1887 family protein [Gammaproteobacteria bacterium]